MGERTEIKDGRIKIYRWGDNPDVIEEYPDPITGELRKVINKFSYSGVWDGGAVPQEDRKAMAVGIVEGIEKIISSVNGSITIPDAEKQEIIASIVKGEINALDPANPVFQGMARSAVTDIRGQVMEGLKKSPLLSEELKQELLEPTVPAVFPDKGRDATRDTTKTLVATR